jgi:hypothetical protein
MKKLLPAIAIALLPGLAWGQGAVLQNGPVVKFDLPGWVQDKTIMSGGKMFTDNFRGFNKSHFFDNHGDGVCTEDALTSGAYHQLCIGHDTSGNATISTTANNGATPQGINININGTPYAFPGSGTGNTVSPTSPAGATNNLAAFNGGTALKDSKLGVLANGGLNANISQTGGVAAPGMIGRYFFTDVNTNGFNNGSFWFNHDISGTSLSGDRAAVVSVLNQSGAVASSSSPGYNYSALNAYSQMNYNMGGTDSTTFATSVGQNFGANIIAQLGPGATHWGGNVGLEVDVQHTVAGASVFKQVGIYSVKIGVVKGTLDAAFAADAQSTYKWGTGLDLGLASDPYDINSKLIGCRGCGSGIKNGLYWPGVTFTDFAFKFGGAIAADNLGNISIAGSSFVVGVNQPFRLATGGQGTMFSAVGPANPTVIANQVTIVGTATTGSPAVTATGTDTNINLALVAKGTGAVSPIGLVNLSFLTNGGASAKSVCVDTNGLLLTKVGAC